MKKIIAIALLAFSYNVHAEEYVAVLTGADCTMIAKSGSATGAIVGSAAGAGIGSAVGRSLFGKNGGWIGGIGGAIGGGLAGENLGATKTYSCVVKFLDPKGKETYAEVVGPQRSVGQSVRVYQTNSQVIVR